MEISVPYAVTTIMATAVGIAILAYWWENRTRDIGIASYVGSLLTTVVAATMVGMVAVLVYLGVFLLYAITGSVTRTLELTILILGSLVAVQHIHIQAEKNRRERDQWANRMQEAWTRSITKVMVAENVSPKEEAAEEVRQLYRECRTIMNNDASLLLSRIMGAMAELTEPDYNSEQKTRVEAWLRGLIMPTVPVGESEPATTAILEVFRAYRRGGLSGWYMTRRLLRDTEPTRPGILLAKTGLVEHEDAILGRRD